MNSRPLVDVILCCYNQEQYIEVAVKSILRQKIAADVRILVADDSSKDSTIEIIRSCEQESPFPFEYLPNERNIGFVANYRRAFAACKGKYVAILEGDDEWRTNDHLEQHVKFLESHPSYSMSYNRMSYYLQERGRRILYPWPFKKEYDTLSIMDTFLYGNQIGNLSACCFRRKWLQQLPEELFNHYIADWEIGMFMATKGPIGQLEKPTSMYRINQKGQWSGMEKESMLQSQMDTLELMKPYLPKYCSLLFPIAKRNIKKGVTRPIPASMKTRMKGIVRKNNRNKKK